MLATKKQWCRSCYATFETHDSRWRYCDACRAKVAAELGGRMKQEAARRAIPSLKPEQVLECEARFMEYLVKEDAQA